MRVRVCAWSGGPLQRHKRGGQAAGQAVLIVDGSVPFRTSSLLIVDHWKISFLDINVLSLRF